MTAQRFIPTALTAGIRARDPGSSALMGIVHSWPDKPYRREDRFRGSQFRKFCPPEAELRRPPEVGDGGIRPIGHDRPNFNGNRPSRLAGGEEASYKSSLPQVL